MRSSADRSVPSAVSKDCLSFPELWVFQKKTEQCETHTLPSRNLSVEGTADGGVYGQLSLRDPKGGRRGKRGKVVTRCTFSYKMNKFWECNVQRGDYS